MNKQALTRGALAGMAGGVVMAMWSMIVLWLTGSGFWTPLNLIAHTLWRSAPVNASSVGGTVIGLVVHMMMSMGLGMALAAIVGTVRVLGADRVRRAGTGMVFGVWSGWSCSTSCGRWSTRPPRRCSRRGCSRSGI
jgi:hypothetical protein